MPSAAAGVENTLDLGLIGSENSKIAYFVLLNHNPVDVKILNVGKNIQSGSVVLIGCAKENHANDIHFPPTNMTKCVSNF